MSPVSWTHKACCPGGRPSTVPSNTHLSSDVWTILTTPRITSLPTFKAATAAPHWFSGHGGKWKENSDSQGKVPHVVTTLTEARAMYAHSHSKHEIEWPRKHPAFMATWQIGIHTHLTAKFVTFKSPNIYIYVCIIIAPKFLQIWKPNVLYDYDSINVNSWGYGYYRQHDFQI